MTEYRCWSCDETPIVTGDDLKYCRSLGHQLLPEPNNKKIEGDDTSQFDFYEDEKQIIKVMKFVEPLIRLTVISQDDSDRVYALVSNNNHFETMQFGSLHLKNWLKTSHYKKTRECFSDQSYTSALELIKGNALFDEKTTRTTIHKRIAFENDAIYFDLCTPDWKLVKISKDSIEIVEHGKDTPLFQRSKNQAIQLVPVFRFDGNPLEKFCKLIRIDNPLFVPHLISFFIENIPVPMIAILGQQGSIKSTQSGLIKRLIDPSGKGLDDNLNHMPKDVDNININFAHNYLVAYDNVSFISDEISDTLCKAITGASYTKRMLYTDSDEIILRFQRKIIINGISMNIDRGDLMERTIQYFTSGIPSGERKTAREVETEFTELLPELLGQIFNILQKMLQSIDTVRNELKDLPRMADFAIWGETASRVLGNPNGRFLKQYADAISQGNDILSETNPLIPFIEQEMGRRDSFLDSTGLFYGKLLKFASENNYDIKSGGFPRGSNKLRPYIERSRPLLSQAGYGIRQYKNTETNAFHKNASMILVEKLRSPSSPPSLTVPPEPPKSDLGEGGEHPYQMHKAGGEKP